MNGTSENTQIITKQPDGSTQVSESSIFGMSSRAWLATMLVFTVCMSHVAVVTGTIWDAVLNKSFDKVGNLTTIGEPLYSMSVAALGFYFGQNKNKQ